MSKSVLVRIGSDLDKAIRKIQVETENQAGIKISYSQASTVYIKMQTYKNFKVKIKGKGVVEISQP